MPNLFWDIQMLILIQIVILDYSIIFKLVLNKKLNQNNKNHGLKKFLIKEQKEHIKKFPLPNGSKKSSMKMMKLKFNMMFNTIKILSKFII